MIHTKSSDPEKVDSEPGGNTNIYSYNASTSTLQFYLSKSDSILRYGAIYRSQDSDRYAIWKLSMILYRMHGLLVSFTIMCIFRCSNWYYLISVVPLGSISFFGDIYFCGCGILGGYACFGLSL
ncbi:hypothetical protein O6H91_08G063800 [Diphasiastrum complanatum]|uniref:Uncharacterized protein n=1 Tax=Diphasiastrum complanatum TaxID=34168 RepID=A0ACC2CY87_DIPCM|nr:hypothetical protein O6H91_08G063800 [Diphasiastrum complanatum]